MLVPCLRQFNGVIGRVDRLLQNVSTSINHAITYESKIAEREKAVNLNVLNNLTIGDDGVVTVATPLESVTPPAGNKYVNSIRDVGSEHIPKHFHGFSQRLFIGLSFDSF